MKLPEALVWMTLIACITYNCHSKADSVEVVGGGYTYHLIDFGTADYYQHGVTANKRLIANPTMGLLYHQKLGSIWYRSIGAFTGQNSIGRPMEGIFYSDGLELKNFQAGVGLGAYVQQSRYFSDLGINSFRLTNINGTDIVPLVGLVFNYKVDLTDNIYIKINNLVTPILTNHTLSLGFNY